MTALDISSWIGGLMAEMTNQVQPGCFSLIPFDTIQYRYIAKNRYVLQEDERGKPVGYILHGAIHYGQPMVISQHAIIYDKWLLGYGQSAFYAVVERARRGGASAIRLRCADDLPANQFWQSLGFQIVGIESGGAKRNRTIVKMVFPLLLPLFATQPALFAEAA